MSTAALPQPTMNTPNVLAALISAFIPGLGQLIQGRVLKGLLFLFVAWPFMLLVSFLTIMGGLLPQAIVIWGLTCLALWIWGIVDAARYTPRDQFEPGGKTPWQCNYCQYKGVSCDGPDLEGPLKESLKTPKARRRVR